jgi:hypothetical protein
LKREKVLKGEQTITRSRPIVESLDGENGENPRFPMLLLLQSGS